MDHPADKDWARSYLLDPLSEPQPSEETGPGTTFRPESVISELLSPPESARKLSKNPPQRSFPSKTPGASTTEVSNKGKRASYPSPPKSASPQQARALPSYRDETFYEQGSPRIGTRSRGSSRAERVSGNNSHRPLEQIKKDTKSANRSPHLRKSHQILPDTVDKISTVGGGPYHHEGPYDAALYARNKSDKSAPLNALEHSNLETLKATPKEKVLDSVRAHRPLDGVATYAPGEADRNGYVYNYEQGDNMMISGGNPEGGAYKRWPGVRYHSDDLKGKGEPSYSIEKALKGHGKAMSSGDFEMTSRPKYPGDSLSNAAGNDAMWGDGEESRLRRRSGNPNKARGSAKEHRH